jgi:hypothetical protein
VDFAFKEEAEKAHQPSLFSQEFSQYCGEQSCRGRNMNFGDVTGNGCVKGVWALIFS